MEDVGFLFLLFLLLGILKIEQITNGKINIVYAKMKESDKLFNKCEGIVKMCFSAATSHAETDRTNKNKMTITSQTSTLWSIGSNKPQIQRTKQQHQERVVKDSLTQTKQKQTKRNKKDETEKG